MDKRILIFSTSYFPEVGGAEVALREITNRLTDYSFVLICAKHQSGLLKRERIGRVDVHRVGLGMSFDRYLLPFLGPLLAVRLVSNQTLVWSMMAGYAGFAGLFYCWLRPKTIFLLTLQEGHPLDFYEKRLGVFAGLHRRIFRRANYVQAISQFLANWGKQMGFIGLSEVIPNGVDIESFAKPIEAGNRKQIREMFGFADDDIVLVTTSRLSLKNAVDDVVRALSRLPMRFKFLVVGVGEDEAMLRTLVDELGVKERVVFTGYHSHAEMPELLRSSEIFIRPSLSEGLGNSFLEAMSAEIPIIGTPVGGIPDFLVDGETGIFCQPRDPESIAKAVERLITEPGLRERVVQNGAKLVREHYDWDEICRRMKTLFTRITL